MARIDTSGLDTLLNVLLTRRQEDQRAQEISDAQAFSAAEAQKQRDFAIQQAESQRQQAESQRQQAFGDLQTNLYLGQRAAEEEQAQKLLDLKLGLLTNADMSKLGDIDVNDFDAIGALDLATLLSAQRVEETPVRRPAGKLPEQLFPVSRLRNEWGSLDAVQRQQYGTFENYSQVRYPELIGEYNMVAPQYNYPTINITEQVDTQDVVQEAGPLTEGQVLAQGQIEDLTPLQRGTLYPGISGKLLTGLSRILGQQTGVDVLGNQGR